MSNTTDVIASPIPLTSPLREPLNPEDVRNRTNYVLQKAVCNRRLKGYASLAFVAVVLAACSSLCPPLLITGILLFAVAAALAILQYNSLNTIPPTDNTVPVQTEARIAGLVPIAQSSPIPPQN